MFLNRAFFVTDEEGPYKPVPPPKPVSNNQKNNQDDQQDEQREQTVVERSSLRTTSGPERTSVVENGQVRSAAGQPFAPEYRMPPLYGEEQSSGQTQQAASLQTHSSKFPVSVIMIINSGMT